MGWNTKGRGSEIADIAVIAEIGEQKPSPLINTDDTDQEKAGDRKVNSGVESYKPFGIIVGPTGGRGRKMGTDRELNW
jgi:hypothetical protein